MAKRGESDVVNGVSTVPQPTIASGLMASDTNNGKRINIFAGPTTMPSTLRLGDYVFAVGHIRKVVGFYPNETAFRIDEPFPVNLTFSPLLIVRQGAYSKVSIFNTSTSITGTIQNKQYIDKPLPPQVGIEWSSEQGLAPILYDTQGAEFIIATTEA